MTRPYPRELRERIVRVVESGASQHAAAARFGVSTSCVNKLVKRWRARGTVEPDQYGGWMKPSLARHAELIRAMLSAEDEITLERLRRQLAVKGITTSCTTLHRFLKAQGLVRKRAGACGL